jgi:hypothetical protein
MSTSKIVSGIMDKLKHKPIYIEDRGGVTLSFRDTYHLQDFVGEIRKHGVVYGIELSKLTEEAPPMNFEVPKVPAISVVRWISRGEKQG